MLKIRLTRTGKKKQAQYRIIVSERRSKRDGAYIANLGHYTPTIKPAILKLDIASYDQWLTKGAQPTETVKYLRTLTKSNDQIEIKSTPKNKNFKAKKASQS